ncbi:heavy metal efflux pump, CzcA family [Leptospira fainei serovar Hurstbridge str. BUT 6]|uniref:Heavy metal efflux pump, CzcA family n=1 Tax=Leptospira fainei serovar Hurstbridge str. BUT 6 TaxID=1193011 RepID=S3V613_9LEPT|nr:CusA/CzcA family heavy metal efflux RND transporter [Leptospira fainei]EPG76084.1 heavy metal efflux pump, CzcA family [Leptospira fainei serovar Hurstbridge str. BUT 6]
MIQNIIRFSAHNKFLILLFTLGVLVAAYVSMKTIPLDAIPDLSDTQVIVYSRWDRSPDIIEDQVTYPIITSLLGAPKIKVVRGFSDFGFSYVYVIFQDGTDIYWARSRVLEYLSRIQSQLPAGVKTELGPDASAVGWVFQYALVDTTGNNSLADLRTYQDFHLRYLLNSVPGVSEVAGIGGFKKQYQITINPNALRSYNIGFETLVQKIRESNQETGGRLLEISGAEYMVRGRGYLKSITDIENIPLSTDVNGTPVLLKNIAAVQFGPDIRRGIADLNGEGDVVGGTIVMRHGENALSVIERVKAKINDIKASLPAGAEIITTYDRSELIDHAISNLKFKLMEEMLIVSLVILVFLWHFPSAIIPILTIPISVIVAFIPMNLLDVNANIMSLAGMAISIGVLVDGAIVEVENAYKKLEEWESGGRKGDYHMVRLEALLEVGPSVFFSLLVIAVAFFPIFTLVDQEGRLFRPLAYSKNIAMAVAALLAITLDPAFRMLFTRMEPFRFKSAVLSKVATTLFVGKYYPEEKHPVSKILFRLYEPACHWVLERPKTIIASALALVFMTVPVYLSLGSEFMPQLYEESLLYMPTTLPGISVAEAEKLMVSMDKKIKSFPEVKSVFGKAGRSDTATDSAPFSMMETVILLKPQDEWRTANRFYSNWPRILQLPFLPFVNERLSKDELIELMNREMQFPGATNAWTMPIKTRIDMLSTGMRTPIGIKVLGSSLEEIEKIGIQIETLLKTNKDVRSVFAERTAGGYFLDLELKREKLARYNISVDAAQQIIVAAIGGEQVTQTVEGRERFSVNVRYPRELRDSVEKIRSILVPTQEFGHIPIGEIADIKTKTGPSMIRDENGFLAGYVYVDPSTSDIGGFVDQAKRKVSDSIKLPAGYSILWSGQYENMLRVRERMRYILPLTIFIIFLLLYFNTKSYAKTLIVLLAVPFSLIGAVGLLYILDYHVSVAVWVGMIALMGLDAETGVFMLLYLDLSYDSAERKGMVRTREDRINAIIDGAVHRVRPKIMTVLAAMMGLLPIMWSNGTGSDVMKRIAAPMVGGLATSFLLELLVYPPIYLLWKEGKLTFAQSLPAVSKYFGQNESKKKDVLISQVESESETLPEDDFSEDEIRKSAPTKGKKLKKKTLS